jgi:Flp pilus assembly protein TadG
MLRKLLNPFGARRFRRSQDGAVAVEFALVIVPFLMMIFGIFETGQVLWTSSQIDFHVDEVVREAAVDSSITSGQIETRIADGLSGLDAGRLTIDVVRNNGTPDILTVSVTYIHQPVTPFLFEDGITLSHTTSYPMIDN